MKLTVRGVPQLSTRAMHPVMVDMPFLGYIGQRTTDGRMIRDLIVDLPVNILGVQGDPVGFIAEVVIESLAYNAEDHWRLSGLGYVNHSRPRGYPSISVTGGLIVDDGDGRTSTVGARLAGVQLLVDEINLWDEPIPPLRGVPPSEQKARRW